MNTENMNQTEEMKNKKKAEPKGQLFRVALPEHIGAKAQEAIAALKERGADLKLEDLLKELIDKADERYFDRQVEKLTPDTFIFEQAKNHPEILASLIKKAKRAIEQKSKPTRSTQTKKQQPAGADAL